MLPKKGSIFALFGCPPLKKGPKMRPFFALFEKNAKKKSKFRKKGLQKRPFWLLRPFFFKKKRQFSKKSSIFCYFSTFQKFSKFRHFLLPAALNPQNWVWTDRVARHPKMPRGRINGPGGPQTRTPCVTTTCYYLICFIQL